METVKALETSKAQKSGVYQKGKDRINNILDAATTLLIDIGYSNFSMRKVADAAGIKLGNLQYYFPSKNMLVCAMLDRAIQVYLDEFDEIRTHGTPEQQFRELIQHVVTDLTSKQTTQFFPELWSMSNHDKEITVFMDQMYSKYRAIMGDIIADLNPKLNVKQVEKLSLFFSASMEGHTIFIGYKKPWTGELDNIISMATQSFIWLVQNGEIPN